MNNSAGISVNASGILALSSLSQSQKQLFPMEVTLSGTTISLTFVQPLNAPSPSVFTPFSMVISFAPLYETYNISLVLLHF